MKKVRLTIASLLSLLAIFNSCDKNEPLPHKAGSVVFSISQKTRNGRTQETPIPAFVLIGIQDAAGKTIYQNHKVALYAFGQAFVSEGVEVPFGINQLVDFKVLDANSKVIYAAPMEGSDLASEVRDALPIELNVPEDGSIQVNPEVLSVLGDDVPESFGYASFGFEIVSPSRQVKQLHFSEAYGYNNTIAFHYDQGRVSKADWNVVRTYPSVHSVDYTEKRNYNTEGQLISLKGDNVWDLAYTYSYGTLAQIVTYRDIGWTGVLKYSSTSTLQAYTNGLPSKMRIDSYIPNLASFSSLNFNSSGNLINIRVMDENNEIERDMMIVYTHEKNPLKNLLETPIIDMYGYHHNNLFAYSENLPKTVTRMRYFDYDGAYEKMTLSYTYSKDNFNRVIAATVSVKVVMGVPNKFENETLNSPAAYNLKIIY